MTYTLILGDPAYSSWSMRAYALMDHFSLPFDLVWVDFSNEDGVAAQLPEGVSGRTVPALLTDDGLVADSIAIAEELAARHPDLPLWPQDTKLRVIARNLVAEMHSSFGPLRTDCPMNLRVAYSDFVPRAEVQADVDRIVMLWDKAMEARGATQSPWLCGDYGIVDAFYAPVAARLAGYGFELPANAAAYVQAHLAHPSFRKWRDLGLVQGPDLPWYALPYATTEWPS